MKKISVLLLASAVILLPACAQKLSESKVPAPVKESFSKQFPGVTVKWEKEDGKYEAVFRQQDHEMSALFEANGTLSETEMELTVAELPATITEYVSANYKGVTLKGGARIIKPNGEVQYEAVLKGKELIFDANGKFLKEEKE